MHIDWLRVLAALTVSELIHNMFEVWGMRQKVKWLNLTLKGKPHGNWPINVDTNLKVWSLHIGMLLVFGSLTYASLTILKLDEVQTTVFTAVTLLACYVATVFKVHLFHNEIGELIKNAKKI